MRRGTLFIISLIVGIFLLTACGKNGPSKDAVLDPDIFGTWKQITEDGSASLEDIGIPSGYVFNEDGTGEDLFWALAFTYQTDNETSYTAFINDYGFLIYNLVRYGESITLCEYKPAA